MEEQEAYISPGNIWKGEKYSQELHALSSGKKSRAYRLQMQTIYKQQNASCERSAKACGMKFLSALLLQQLVNLMMYIVSTQPADNNAVGLTLR